MLYYEIIYLSVILLVGLMYVFMPSIVNKYVQFGVSVNDELLENEEVKDTKKKYQQQVIVLLVSILIVYVINIFVEFIDVQLLFPILLGVLLIVLSIVYLIAHYKVKRIKGDLHIESSSFISVELSGEKSLKTVSNYLYIIPLLIVIGTIVYTLISYPEFPEVIGTNQSGSASEKSYLLALFMPGMMLFMTVLFFLINISIKTSKKVSGVSNRKISFEQEYKSKYLWSVILYIMSIFLVLLFLYIQLIMFEVVTFHLWIIYSVTPAILILVLVLVVYAGQSGNRLKSEKNKHDVIDKDDDKYWKLGSIYVNKEDPSLFVDKRFGVGLTLNFGNYKSWLILIGFFVFIIGILIVSFSL